jgi:hypothetical protein
METCAQCQKLILGCPTKSQSVALSCSLSASSMKSEPRFVIFAKFYDGNMCTMSKNDFGVPYQIPDCRAEFSGCFEFKSEPGFVIFVKFYHGNLCTMSKIDFGVPYQITECHAEFHGCLAIKSEPGFVIFAKFSYISMCQNIQKASQFPKTP